jgi:hypothetical protein
MPSTKSCTISSPKVAHLEQLAQRGRPALVEEAQEQDKQVPQELPALLAQQAHPAMTFTKWHTRLSSAMSSVLTVVATTFSRRLITRPMLKLQVLFQRLRMPTTSHSPSSAMYKV